MEKLIIFDMDGTLYDLNDVIQMSYNMQTDFFSAKTGRTTTETKFYFEENNIYPIIKKESKSATELFVRMGIDIDEWSDYRDEHFDVNAIDITKAVKDELIAKFAENYPLVLLSSNSFSCINKIFDHIKCSLSYFKEVICSDRYAGEGRFNKQSAMIQLNERYNIAFNNMISIGDRYKTDIEPILELGGSGILLKKNNILDCVLDSLNNNNLISCDEYEYYNNK